MRLTGSYLRATDLRDPEGECAVDPTTVRVFQNELPAPIRASAGQLEKTFRCGLPRDCDEVRGVRFEDPGPVREARIEVRGTCDTTDVPETDIPWDKETNRFLGEIPWSRSGAFSSMVLVATIEPRGGVTREEARLELEMREREVERGPVVRTEYRLTGERTRVPVIADLSRAPNDGDPTLGVYFDATGLWVDVSYVRMGRRAGDEEEARGRWMWGFGRARPQRLPDDESRRGEVVSAPPPDVVEDGHLVRLGWEIVEHRAELAPLEERVDLAMRDLGFCAPPVGEGDGDKKENDHPNPAAAARFFMPVRLSYDAAFWPLKKESDQHEDGGPPGRDSLLTETAAVAATSG